MSIYFLVSYITPHDPRDSQLTGLHGTWALERIKINENKSGETQSLVTTNLQVACQLSRVPTQLTSFKTKHLCSMSVGWFLQTVIGIPNFLVISVVETQMFQVNQHFTTVWASLRGGYPDLHLVQTQGSSSIKHPFISNVKTRTMVVL